MDTTGKIHRAILASFSSQSRPGVEYHVHLGADGNVWCDCPSWRFQKNHPQNRVCKHTRAALSRMFTGGVSVTEASNFPEPKAVRAPRTAAKPAKPAPSVWERLSKA